MTRDNRKYWADVALKHLKGRTIVDAFYCSEEDQEALGWNDSGLVLVLDNGAQVIPQADDEGNGPGALVVATEENSTILPVV